MSKEGLFVHNRAGDDMKTTSRQASGFLFLYFISTAFYSNRILTRFIFQASGKWGWIFIWGIALVILLTSIPLYHLLKSIRQPTLPRWATIIIKSSLMIYLVCSAFISLAFLTTLTNTGWLFQTNLFLIIVPLLGICYYILNHRIEVFLRLATICFYPILAQYFIFVLAQNKSFDLYALIPFTITGDIHYLVVFMAGLNMIFDGYLCLFYFSQCQTPIKKIPFFFLVLFHVFSLGFDSIIASGQFGNLLKDMPFAYYESWRLINFGQFIVYLDTFAFFYWVTSALLRLALLFYLIKDILPQKHYYYPLSYFLIAVGTVYVLHHATLYTALRLPLLFVSTMSLIIAVLLDIYFLRKKVKA